MSLMSYVPLFADNKSLFDLLTDEQLAKVVRALLEYNETGQRPVPAQEDAFTLEVFLTGFERSLAFNNKQRENAKQSKRKQSENKTSQTEPDEAKPSQSKPSEAKASQAKPKQALNRIEKNRIEEIRIDSILAPSETSSLDAEGENSDDGLPDTPEDFTAPAEESAPFLDLPLIDGSSRTVTKAETWHWSALYPAVDVEEEIRKMVGWLESNPKNRKTKAGINRFINGWLVKAQDRAKRQPSPYNQPKRVEAQCYQQRQYSDDAFDGLSPAQLEVLSRVDSG